VWKVPIWLSLTAVATSITITVMLSLRATRDLQLTDTVHAKPANSTERADEELVTR
jgi:hypothetical protein